MKRPVIFCALLLLGSGNVGADPLRVAIPSPNLTLTGILYPAPSVPAPAVILLHGCSGMHLPNGRVNPSYVAWAQHLQRQGFHALLLDSFGPRGEREICTQQSRKVSERRDRPGDAQAARAWLAARTDVDSRRIHALGWSNGGSTVLHMMRGDSVPTSGQDFRSAVAMYPGCRALAKATYQARAPVLIQAGEADDWTPAADCAELARGATGAPVLIDVYPDAHHGFDRTAPGVRYRPDVRNLASATGRGATVAANPEARRRAFARVTEFLQTFHVEPQTAQPPMP